MRIVQVTQQVFVAKECVRSAHNKFEAESNFRCEVERTLWVCQGGEDLASREAQNL